MKMVASLLFLLTAVTDASIGESREELIKRYGETEENGNRLHFSKDGMRISATLWKDKCHSISFLLIDKDIKDIKDLARARKFTSEEIETLLSKNPAGTTYLPPDAKFEKISGMVRKSSDGKFIAAVSPHLIVIQSVEYYDQEHHEEESN